MKQILTIFFAALMFTACQSQSATDEGSNTTPLTSESNTDIPTHNPAHGQPYHDCSIAVGAPLVVKEPTSGVKKLNPAHGQPGHRCDIAVGAPLT